MTSISTFWLLSISYIWNINGVYLRLSLFCFCTRSESFSSLSANLNWSIFRGVFFPLSRYEINPQIALAGWVSSFFSFFLFSLSKTFYHITKCNRAITLSFSTQRKFLLILTIISFCITSVHSLRYRSEKVFSLSIRFFFNLVWLRCSLFFIFFQFQQV